MTTERNPVPSDMAVFEESPLLVRPTLAALIGVNEAIFLNQIHYWLEQYQNDPKHRWEGRPWIFNSAADWRKQFPFWSSDTIKRLTKRLRKLGLIETRQFDKRSWKMHLYYTINYSRVQDLITEANPAVAAAAEHDGAVMDVDNDHDAADDDAQAPEALSAPGHPGPVPGGHAGPQVGTATSPDPGHGGPLQTGQSCETERSRTMQECRSAPCIGVEPPDPLGQARAVLTETTDHRLQRRQQTADNAVAGTPRSGAARGRSSGGRLRLETRLIDVHPDIELDLRDGGRASLKPLDDWYAENGKFDRLYEVVDLFADHVRDGKVHNRVGWLTSLLDVHRTAILEEIEDRQEILKMAVAGPTSRFRPASPTD